MPRPAHGGTHQQPTSTQPILDISKTLIGKQQGKAGGKIEGLNKDLLASNSHINHLNHPEIHEYNTVKEEMAGIAGTIENYCGRTYNPAALPCCIKRIKLKSWANICAWHSVYSKRINILEQPFVQKLIQLLRCLNAERYVPAATGYSLRYCATISSPPPIEIIKLTVETNQKRYNDPSVSLRKLM